MIATLATHRRAPLMVFAALAVLYVLTMSRGYVSIDPQANDIFAQHFAQTGSPWVEHAPYLHPDPRNPFLQAHGTHLYIQRTPGPGFLAVPAYFLFAYGSDVLHTWPGSLTAALLSAGAMAFLFAGLRRRISPSLALLGLFATALTTPLWSVSADALWSHPVTVFGIALAVWGSAGGRSWVTGLGYAVAITGRPHVAVIAAVHGLHESIVKRSFRPLLGIGVPSVVSLAVTLGWNRFLAGPGGAVYGKGSARVVPGSVPRESGNSYFHDLLGFLISPNRGLFFWTPLLVVLLVLAVRHWRRTESWSRGMALGGAAYALVQLDLNGFSGGNAFYGYRLGLETLIAVTPLCFFALAAAGPRPVWLTRLLAALVGWQLATVAIGSFDAGSHYDGVRVGVLEQQNRWLVNGAWYTATHFWWLGILMPPLFVLGYVVTSRLLAEGPRPLVSERSLT